MSTIEYLELLEKKREMEKLQKTSCSLDYIIESMKGNATELIEFATMLSSPQNRELCGDLAVQAMDSAVEAKPQDVDYHLSLFQTMHQCGKDTEVPRAD